MKLTKKEVEHIALLARMAISEEEKELFSKQLSSILDYVGQLQEVKSDNTSETNQVTGIENAIREDIIENCPQDIKDQILKNAPEVEDNLLKTKTVF